MKLWRLNKLILASIGAFALMLEVANAQKVSSKDLEKVEKQVKEQNLEHQRLKEQASQISKELKQVNQQMIKSAKMIQYREESLSKMEAELEELTANLQKAEETFLAEDENLIKTLSALQNLALKPTESLFVQPLSPVEIIRSAMLLRETVPYLEENANNIRKDLESLQAKKKQIEKQVSRITKQKLKLEKEHEEMKVLVQKKSKLRNVVEVKSEKAKKRVQALASQAQDLRDLLNKLEKERQEKLRRQEEERRRLTALEEQRRKEALENQKREQVQTADLIKFNPEVISEIGDNFVKAKGKLSRPARGSIVTAYGQETAKGVSSKGIIIKTRPKAQVIAPFDGSVLFAGPFRGYGNLIIIEHGKGYTSLLAGLDSIDCDVGQMLLAGEPIGLMPEEDDARLYMELRNKNHPINPISWFAN